VHPGHTVLRIQPHHLAARIETGRVRANRYTGWKIPLDEIARRATEATLASTGGDKTRAARALGIGRKTLYRKLRQYEGGDSAPHEAGGA
jgi:DNA-binding NtrC family response regulator